MQSVPPGAYTKIQSPHFGSACAIARHKRLFLHSCDQECKYYEAPSTLREAVSSLSFHPHGNLIAVVGSNSVKLLSCNDHHYADVTFSLTTEAGVEAADFSPDGMSLATYGRHNVKIHDIAVITSLSTLTGGFTGSALDHWNLTLPEITCFAWSRGGEFAIGCDNTVTVWQRRDSIFVPQCTLNGHSDSVKSVAFCSVGSMTVTGSVDATVKLWDEGRCICTINHSGAPVTLVAFSPNGAQIVSCGIERVRTVTVLRVWNLHGQLCTELRGHVDIVTSIAFRNDGLLASACFDGTIRLWNLATQCCVQTMSCVKPRSVSFSPDGDTICAVPCDRTKLPMLWSCKPRRTMAVVTTPFDIRRVDCRGPDIEISGTDASERVTVHFGFGAERAFLLQELALRDDPYCFDPRLCKVAFPNFLTLDARGARSKTLHVGATPLPSHLGHLWSCGGRHGRPVEGFEWVRFDALSYEPDDDLLTGLKICARRVGNTRAQNVAEYVPNFEGAKARLLATFNKSLIPAKSLSCGHIVYTFHGCHNTVVGSILTNSLLALHRNDGGFFGSGVYVTTSIEYAARYALGEFNDGDVNPPSVEPTSIAAPPGGCYPVICLASFVTVVYPLTRDEDYPNGALFSQYNAGPTELPKALKPGCDAHLAFVAEDEEFQAARTGLGDYYELVQPKEHIVPMGVLWVRSTSAV